MPRDQSLELDAGRWFLQNVAPRALPLLQMSIDIDQRPENLGLALDRVVPNPCCWKVSLIRQPESQPHFS